MSRLKTLVKKVLPKSAVEAIKAHRYRMACRRNERRGIPNAPPGTDLVGYETLIEVIRDHRLLTISGDLLEIGTFLGGGARRLAKFLENNHSSKLLYVVDVFDPAFDWTATVKGEAMAALYAQILSRHKGRTQWEVFREVTGDCRNITVLRGDSRRLTLPANALCFGFVDGNHDPEYVENDFYLVWNKLSSGGAVAFHDYGWDLPQTTARIDLLLQRHASEIHETRQDRKKHVLFVFKK